MPSYIPNALEPELPLESNTVESAAIEFRTLKDSHVRTLRYPDADAPNNRGELPAANERAGFLLAFDPVNGTPVVGPDTSDVVDLVEAGQEIISGLPFITTAVATAQAAAVASQTSATNSQNSATAAAQSEVNAAASALTATQQATISTNQAVISAANRQAAQEAAVLANNSAVSAQASKVDAATSAQQAANSANASEVSATEAQVAAGNASLIIAAGLGFTNSTAYDFGYVTDMITLFPTDFGLV